MNKNLGKIALALVLALVMVFTVTGPALAGKPTRGTLNPESGVSGTAKYALQATKNGSLKVAVTLIGVQPDFAYTAYVEWRYAGNLTADGTFGAGDIMTSGNGRGSVRHSQGGAYNPQLEYRVKVRFTYTPFTIKFVGDWVAVAE